MFPAGGTHLFAIPGCVCGISFLSWERGEMISMIFITLGNAGCFLPATSADATKRDAWIPYQPTPGKDDRLS